MPAIIFRKYKKGRISAKKKRLLRRKFFAYFSLVLAVLAFAGAIQLSFAESLNIQKVIVIGEKENAWKAQKFLHKEIFLKNFLIFSPYNKLTLNKQKLLKDLLETYPEIKSAEDVSEKLTELKIKILLRDPEYIYCTKSNVKKKRCYYADKDGFIFKKVGLHFEQESSLPEIYMDESLLERKLRGTILKSKIKKTYIEKTDFISNALKKTKFRAKKFYFDKNGGLEIYFDKFYAKLRQKQVENINYLSFALNNNLLDFDNLDYIDLRFKSRIYYKEKADEKETVE